MDFTIRKAVPEDAEALLRIYAPYVTETAVTFECEVPSVGEFAKRIASTSAKYPYLVAEREGVPVAYAYAGPFKGRASYDWSVELSVYVAQGRRGGGLGRALYESLEGELRAMGVLNLYACIAQPRGDDEFLTDASRRFHERMGYTLLGEFPQCASKFGRWYDMVWMGKSTGEHCPDPRPVAWPRR